MSGLPPVAALLGLALAAPPAAPTPAVAERPLWRIAYPGTLLGVAGSAVVFDGYKKATRRGELVAFDAATGRKRATLEAWRAQVPRGDYLGAPFLIGPLIGGTLYPSYSGIALVDPATDRVRLRSRPGEAEYEAFLPGRTHGPMAIAGRAANGALVAILGASIDRDEGRFELRAVDLRSGQRLWRWAPKNDGGGLFVAVAGGRAISFSPGWLQAFDLATGQALWRQPSSICDGEICNGLSDFMIAADDEHVAMKVGKRLAVHAASTGEPGWSGEIPRQLSKVLLVSSGQICTEGEVGITCLDVRGRVLWRLPLAGTEPPRLEFGGGNLYVADMGVVRAVDRATGELRWAFGGDRLALAPEPDASGTPATVIIGEDGEGAVAYTADRPPGPARDITVTGRLTVHAYATRPPPPEFLRVYVAGSFVHPGADGRYEVRVRLSGGRIAISAAGCSGKVGPIHLRLDQRSTYQKDLVLDDYCGD
jgi:outer membrane protein assembly factor BamB